MKTLTMSQKEIKKYDIIMRLIRGEINGTETAAILALSVRQIKRLKRKVKEKGAAGLIHGNRGRPCNRKIPQKEKDKIIKSLHKHYYDFQPTHASEKLAENHKIFRDPKTIRTIMIEEELWKPRKGKRITEHRKWRPRKEYYGEMQQFDGSYHDWFEGRLPESCLLLAVDDATSEITHGRFDTDEGVIPVFRFWLEYLSKHGKPLSVYLDKFSTYKMNQKVAQENHDTQTQFQRAMRELEIEPITAHSCEAKGRVETAFGTLQNRLIKEMRLKRIKTIEAANKYLEEEFIPWYKKRYGIKPMKENNMHRKLISQEQKKLHGTLSRQTERTVQNDFTISFNTRWYQLIKQQPVTICKRDKVIVEEWVNGEIKFRLRGKYLNYEVLPEHAKKLLGRRKFQPWVIAATAQGIKNFEKAKITVK